MFGPKPVICSCLLSEGTARRSMLPRLRRASMVPGAQVTGEVVPPKYVSLASKQDRWLNLNSDRPKRKRERRRRTTEDEDALVSCTERACPYTVIGAPWSGDLPLSTILAAHPQVSHEEDDEARSGRRRKLEDVGEVLVRGASAADALYSPKPQLLRGPNSRRMRTVVLLREPVERALIEAERALGTDDQMLDQLYAFSHKVRTSPHLNFGERGRRTKMTRFLAIDTALVMRDCAPEDSDGRPASASMKLHSYADVMNGTLVRKPRRILTSVSSQSVQCGINPFMLRSAYALHLGKWLNSAPDSILVQSTEELAIDPQAALRGVADFIGLPAHEDWLARGDSLMSLGEGEVLYGGRTMRQLKVSSLLADVQPLERCTFARFFLPLNAALDELLQWHGQRQVPWATAPLRERVASACDSSSHRELLQRAYPNMGKGKGKGTRRRSRRRTQVQE